MAQAKKEIDVLVVYGSFSDRNSYEQVIGVLEEQKRKRPAFTYRFFVCSAHRTPDLLDEIMKRYDFRAVISGAGLAAHLPGVIASKTVRPVFGVPIDSNFGGLDSFLSIAQMPPGVPVLCVPLGKEKEAALSITTMLGQKKLRVLRPEFEDSLPLFEKAVSIITSAGAEHEEGSEPGEGINIAFPSLDEDWAYPLNTIIVPNIPDSGKEDACRLFDKFVSGLLVGNRRAENAALAALEILGLEEFVQGERVMCWWE